MPAEQQKEAAKSTRLKRRCRAVAIVVVGAAVLLLAAFGIDRGHHRDEVLRGVELAGVSLAGKDRVAARRAIVRLQTELATTKIVVRVLKRRFEPQASELGLALDIDHALALAMDAGKSDSLAIQLRWWITRLLWPHPLSGVATLNEKKFAAMITEFETSAIINRPFEGAVRVRGGVVEAEEARAGSVIDRAAARLVVLGEYLAAKRTERILSLAIHTPAQGRLALSDAVSRAKTLLETDVILSAPSPLSIGSLNTRDGDDEPTVIAHFKFSQKMLAKALLSEARADKTPTFRLFFDVHVLAPMIDRARAKLERSPLDARFIVDERDRVAIVPARSGRVIDSQKVAARLLAVASRKAVSKVRRGAFPVEVGGQPPFTTAAARALHVDGLVSEFTTRHPCCRPRVHNIHRMADMIDNKLLMPGETFSINDFVGERTTSKRFVPAPTIVSGRMKDTVGGGVSQFATTFFNAAFYGGYEVVERQPHSYYFARYPMGVEATLSFPQPDLIIRNDTAAGLLIRCNHTDERITIKFYGNNGGRKVMREVSVPFRATKPPTEYMSDPTLHPSRREREQHGSKGWTVRVMRLTRFADGTEKKETRKVIYAPHPNILRVHPCKIPKDHKGHTGKPCPKTNDED